MLAVAGLAANLLAENDLGWGRRSRLFTHLHLNLCHGTPPLLSESSNLRGIADWRHYGQGKPIAKGEVSEKSIEGVLRDLLNLAIADAGSTNTHTLAGALHQGPNRLQIQIPTTLRDIVRVANAVPKPGPAPANFTNLSHKTENS